MRCYYFGCWREAGHYLWAPGGRSVTYSERQAIEYYGTPRLHIDSTLAPRWINGVVGWAGMPAKDDRERQSYERGQQLRNGRCLSHRLDNGYSALAWWDQHQGDSRPGSNCVLLLEGDQNAQQILAAGQVHFARVFENLKQAGIELAEVFPRAPRLQQENPPS